MVAVSQSGLGLRLEFSAHTFSLPSAFQRGAFSGFKNEFRSKELVRRVPAIYSTLDIPG
jgi:hypothetical protein